MQENDTTPEVSLVTKHLPIVAGALMGFKRIRFIPPYIDASDLYQAGVLALMEIIKRYRDQPTFPDNIVLKDGRSIPFKTAAFVYITGKMQHYRRYERRGWPAERVSVITSSDDTSEDDSPRKNVFDGPCDLTGDGRAVNHAAIRSAMAKLTPRQREAIQLVYFEGLTEDQAAEEMGCIRSVVNKRIHAGICNLRKLFCSGGVKNGD